MQDAGCRGTGPIAFECREESHTPYDLCLTTSLFLNSRDPKPAGKFGIQLRQCAVLVSHQHEQMVDQIAHFTNKMLPTRVSRLVGRLDNLGRLFRHLGADLGNAAGKQLARVRLLARAASPSGNRLLKLVDCPPRPCHVPITFPVNTFKATMADASLNGTLHHRNLKTGEVARPESANGVADGCLGHRPSSSHLRASLPDFRYRSE